jgi:hypothetical protein
MQEEIICPLGCFSVGSFNFLRSWLGDAVAIRHGFTLSGVTRRNGSPFRRQRRRGRFGGAMESGLTASMARAGEAEVIVAELRGGFSNGMASSPADLVAPDSQL